jgi:hypothetical protein
VTLDGLPVPGITGSLAARSRVTGPARRLTALGGLAFNGSKVLGQGFVLTPGEAIALLGRDPRNRAVVMPYLTAEDLNSRPDQSPPRWIVNFRDWSAERAHVYKEPFAIVERLVRPERAKVKRAARRERWWRYAEHAPGLYDAIGELERAISIAIVSKTVQPVFVPTDIVFSHAVAVFAYDDDAHFGLLSSGFHWWWAVTRASTMRNDIRYTPSDCFETFPQPDLPPAVGEAGGALDAHRRALMLDRREGLTKTYNRLHDPGDHAADIARLRELHVELDHAVRDAYGWSDLDLGHGFHDTRQGTRFTFEPTARQEILDRLLELTHARHADEVHRGLHDRNRPRRPRRSTGGQGSLIPE